MQVRLELTSLAEPVTRGGDLHLVYEAFGAKRVGLFYRCIFSAFKNYRGDADRRTFAQLAK